ncbi:hypothetical protein [Elizabethkingia miricola]|uniref:hypothetical protein n=1 Tax=Elizabethkingia miricola TaxID=172045 RepID=UPI002ACE2A8D|nr:hypothetical protein [Elizabethkingia miricola]WQM39454.1 hypothetical protein U2S95_04155 [Elizabethkingia miricola]
MIVLCLVKDFRDEMPMLGTRKLLSKRSLHLAELEIKKGRDQLFALLRFHGLLIRIRIRIVKTTDSHHWPKKYPNLVRDLVLQASEQLWVSDITYIRTLEGFNYLSIIIDAFGLLKKQWKQYKRIQVAK